MITIRRREMIVPVEDRIIGVEGENNTSVREFSISRTENDLSGLSFFIDILYEDGTKNQNVILDPVIGDEKIILTWQIIKNDIPSNGTIFVQIKANDLSGLVKWKSFMTPFYVMQGINTGEEYTGDLSAFEALLTDMQNTRLQLDQMVIEGDSSIEAAQARVNATGTVFPTLKARLDSSDNKTLSIGNEFPATTYPNQLFYKIL